MHRISLKMADLDLISETHNRPHPTINNSPSGMQLREVDLNTRNNVYGPRPSTHTFRSGDGLLPDAYHLTSMDNYDM